MTNLVASPSVRAQAREQGIDLAALADKLGRSHLTHDDLKQPSGAGATEATSAIAATDDGARYWDIDHSQYGPVHSEPTSRFSQVAAQNLGAANRLIPQVTHHDRADVSALERFRAELKPEAKARGIKLTALAFQAKALAVALRAFPKFNASLSSDGKTLTFKEFVHIGIAVDTPHGLMVPAVRDVDRKGLWQIASEIADLAARAQERKVSPEEMGGASMTITNLGGIGGSAFTPIVNPPEVAILGITKAELTPVWDGNAFQPVPMLPLDLSYDHRVINGAEAARFMVHFVGLLADPRRMMI